MAKFEFLFRMAGRNFIIHGWDFHDDRWRFYSERSRFYLQSSRLSWWQVEILLLMVVKASQDFYDDRLRFYCKRSRRSVQQIQIFVKNGRNLIINCRNFRMTGKNFHRDKSRFIFCHCHLTGVEPLKEAIFVNITLLFVWGECVRELIDGLINFNWAFYVTWINLLLINHKLIKFDWIVET